MNITAIISAVAAILCFGFAYYKGYDYGSDRMAAKWAQQKAVLDEEYAAGLAAARKKEQDAVAIATDIAKERENASQVIATLGAALRDSLRNRPQRGTATTEASRVSQDTPAAATSAGATGAQLYREDGQFLAGEATVGAEIKAELVLCRKQYEQVQKLYSGSTD